jgi:hypothetical protein
VVFIPPVYARRTFPITTPELERTAGYIRVHEIVRAIINEWDAYSFFAGGTPDDEYEREIASVTRQMERVRSPHDAIHALSRTFLSSFSDSERFSVEACSDVGTQLYEALQKAGFFSPSNVS